MSSPALVVERWLGAAALRVGSVVARGIGMVPPIVSRASGLERPSAAACVAGVVGGTTLLAKRTLGPFAGASVHLVGTAVVVAIATWSVRTSSGEATFLPELAFAIDRAERDGLCSPALARAWRTVTIGAEPGVEPAVAALAKGAARRGIELAVGRARVARALAHAVEVVSLPLDVWLAIGGSARLVDGVARRR